jgi:hypothetical protein
VSSSGNEELQWENSISKYDDDTAHAFMQALRVGVAVIMMLSAMINIESGEVCAPSSSSRTDGEYDMTQHDPWKEVLVVVQYFCSWPINPSCVGAAMHALQPPRCWCPHFSPPVDANWFYQQLYARLTNVCLRAVLARDLVDNSCAALQWDSVFWFH